MSKTQCEQIVGHIERWGHINAVEAIRYYGITRLAARIHDLKDTQHAMKALKLDTTAKGFVTYVPDFNARRARLLKLQQMELNVAALDRIGDINVKYASKQAVLTMREREYNQNVA